MTLQVKAVDKFAVCRNALITHLFAFLTCIDYEQFMGTCTIIECVSLTFYVNNDRLLHSPEKSLATNALNFYRFW